MQHQALTVLCFYLPSFTSKFLKLIPPRSVGLLNRTIILWTQSFILFCCLVICIISFILMFAFIHVDLLKLHPALFSQWLWCYSKLVFGLFYQFVCFESSNHSWYYALIVLTSRLRHVGISHIHSSLIIHMYAYI